MSLKTIAFIVCTILLIPSIQAQEDSAFQRKGFFFGVSLGGSSSFLKFPDKSQDQTDLGIDLKIGCQ